MGGCRRRDAAHGAIAQLGERHTGSVEVKGSSPFSSTKRIGTKTARTF